MSKENQDLPFAGHIVSAMEQFHFIQDLIACMLVWTQKVIISNPERQIVVGTVDVVETVCVTVSKSNDLGNRKGKILTKLFLQISLQREDKHCSHRQ